MKKQTKENLGLVFGSLLSNKKAVEAGKKLPWWMALISFLLAIFLPVIPTMVNISKSYGSQMFKSSNYTYGIDTQLTGASIDIVKNGYEFKIGDDNRLLAYKDSTSFSPSVSEDNKPIAQYVNSVTNQIDFEIYYSSRLAKGSNNLQNLLDTISKRQYKVGTKEEGTNEDSKKAKAASSETIKYYTPSFMLLYADGILLYTYKANTTTTNGNTGGNWRHHEKGLNLFDSLTTVKVSEDTTLTAKTGNKDELLRNASYINGVFDNWKKSFDLNYLDTKDKSFTYSTLIFLGIYFALSFFMGLMVFLLTRGKKNVYRYLSFFTCEKINAWASFCPGLLSLILGFMMPNYAVMFFIALLGLRIMWLSMKELRPQY